MRLSIFALYLSLLAATAVAGPAAAENIASSVSSGLPDLAVRVLPKSDSCGEADICRLVVHLINEGDAPYQGPISVFLDLHAPAVLPPPRAEGPPCSREDYGKFRCDLANVTLEPGGYTTIEPEFLFTATAYESSNACASLKWTPHTLAVRDRLLAAAIEASGHSAQELTRSAGLVQGEDGRSHLLAALLGRWGEGDARSANDSACATIGIVTIRRETPCGPGEINLGGTCKTVAQWCPSNRQHTGVPDRCACPAALPYWNSDTGNCEGQAPRRACATPEADSAQSCRCPSEKPVFNAGKGACVAVEKIVVTTPPPAQPIEPERSIAAKPAKPVGKPEPAVTKADKIETAKPEPTIETARTVPRPPRTATKTAVLTSEQPPATVKRRSHVDTAAVVETSHHCGGLQQWGPYLHRCVPLPIYLMGRLFAPVDLASRCPPALRTASGRCLNK